MYFVVIVCGRVWNGCSCEPVWISISYMVAFNHRRLVLMNQIQYHPFYDGLKVLIIVIIKTDVLYCKHGNYCH